MIKFEREGVWRVQRAEETGPWGRRVPACSRDPVTRGAHRGGAGVLWQEGGAAEKLGSERRESRLGDHHRGRVGEGRG